MARFIYVSILSFCMTGLAHANSQDQIEQLLTQQDAPFGVVFEIVESSDNALQWAIPAVQTYVKQLRQRFPNIGLAVVSHGAEQFALMKEKQNNNRDIHTTVQSLVANDVPVHVCGTYASWQGKAAKDFPAYVDVAPAGPTAIRNYEAMGYVLISVEKP
jgi:intracellular sulfur oxidation DsrE/DsrF family protein